MIDYIIYNSRIYNIKFAELYNVISSAMQKFKPVEAHNYLLKAHLEETSIFRRYSNIPPIGKIGNGDIN